MTTGVYLIKEGEEEEKKGSGLQLSDDRRFRLQWLAFTKSFYAPYADERKLTYFFPINYSIFSNRIVVPKDHPEGIIPRKKDIYNHYNILVQFYEKTKDNRVLDAINHWKENFFGKLPPFPKPRSPKPKPRSSLSNYGEEFFNETSIPQRRGYMIGQNYIYKNGRFYNRRTY